MIALIEDQTARPEVRCGSAGANIDRQTIARARSGIARQMLENCHLCAHHCGVNRVKGELGVCRAGADAHCFSTQIEVSDELELIPVFAVALSGCDLRCDFCITGESSWNPRAGVGFDASRIGASGRLALKQGARSIMILGGEPTVNLAAALELVAEFPKETRLVWKTNGHASRQARELLEGMFDVWVVDFKFGNDNCAERLSGVHPYTGIITDNLLWARESTELIVRHLLMPGHLECCWKPVAKWLAKNLPGVKINLRSGFWPAWHANRHPELMKPARTALECKAREIAGELGLVLVE